MPGYCSRCSWLKTNIRIHASPQAFWNLDRNWRWVCFAWAAFQSTNYSLCIAIEILKFISALRREKSLEQEFTLTRFVEDLIQRAAERDSYFRSVTREDLIDWIPRTSRKPFSQGDQLPGFFIFSLLLIIIIIFFFTVVHVVPLP